jgi:predicted phosphodiesterase
VNLITEKIAYHSRTDEFRLYHLTDTHVGARGCDEKLLKLHIKQIVDDPFALVTLGGDMVDAISRKQDKRHLESTLAPWLWGKDDVLQTQMDYLRDEVLTAALCKKVIAVVSGNHEGAADHHGGAGLYRQIVTHVAQHRAVPPPSIALGYRGFVNLSFLRVSSTGSMGSGWNMHLFITHGYGGGKLAGGHALELERMLGRYEADLILMGHRHTEAYAPIMSSRILGNRIVQTKRIGLLVAGYLGGGAEQGKDEMPLMTYDALNGYYPTTGGVTPVLIDPNERRGGAPVTLAEMMEKARSKGR